MTERRTIELHGFGKMDGDYRAAICNKLPPTDGDTTEVRIAYMTQYTGVNGNVVMTMFRTEDKMPEHFAAAPCETPAAGVEKLRTWSYSIDGLDISMYNGLAVSLAENPSNEPAMISWTVTINFYKPGEAP